MGIQHTARIRQTVEGVRRTYSLRPTESLLVIRHAVLARDRLTFNKLTIPTTREIAIVQLIGAGLTRSQVAERLSLSEGTIKVHLERTRLKLQAANTVEMVIRAIAFGYLSVLPEQRIEQRRYRRVA